MAVQVASHFCSGTAGRVQKDGLQFSFEPRNQGDLESAFFAMDDFGREPVTVGVTEHCLGAAVAQQKMVGQLGGEFRDDMIE